MPKYSVIVENDLSKWEDETGTRYHFPKKYLKVLETGTKVIYYKGKIKDKSFHKNRLSDAPHYFGIATIGEVWRDSTNSKNYFAEIVEYIPFNKALSFKNEENSYYEKIPESKKVNYWRDGVRLIDFDVYNQIINSSDLNKEKLTQNYFKGKSQLSFVKEDLLKYYSNENQKVKTGNINPKFNKEAKNIGDLGERIVYEYLKEHSKNYLPNSLIWHANIGETPGYDISYIDTNNNHICIEVKTTTGKLFNNFIMTINELNTATEIGEYFKIYLVSDCLSNSPKLNILDNPTQESNFKFEPISFKVSKFK